jgi:CelD/BcsL family acetyltransferase involved in cellulose biosynthesis
LLSHALGIAADQISVQLLRAEDREAVGGRWRSLERSIDGGLACSWDWTEAWLDQYGAAVPHWFALGTRGERACGIALITRSTARRGPLRIRRLHLGTAGEAESDSVCVEYNRLLVEPADRGQFARALVGAARRGLDWDELVLDGFAPEDAEPLLAADPAFVAERRASPCFDLSSARANGGLVYPVLPAETRYSLRRSLRGLGAVETEWATEPSQATAILDELIVLHQERWRSAGQPGSFASERFTAFHRDLIRRLLPKQAVVLFRARASGETIGCQYCFVERGRVLGYQNGYRAFGDKRISAGKVVHALCMQECLDRGLAAYDFLAGDWRYKRELSNSESQLVWAAARRGRLKWRAIDGLRALKRRAA